MFKSLILGSSLLAAAMAWQIPSDDWQNHEFGDFGQVSVTNPGRSGDISLYFLSDSIFILGLAMLVNSLATIAIRFFTEKPKEWIESQSLATISVAIAVLGVSINPKSCSYRETIIIFFFILQVVHHQKLKDRRTEQMYDMKLKEVRDLMDWNDDWNEQEIEENREAIEANSQEIEQNWSTIIRYLKAAPFVNASMFENEINFK